MIDNDFSLNLSELKSLQKLVSERIHTPSVKSKSVCSLLDKFKMGRRLSYEFMLSSDELNTLERYFKEHIHQDPITHSLSYKTRTEAARFVANEKWAQGTVFGNLVNLASSTSAITFKTGENIATPKGSVLCASFENLNLSTIKKLVILENGEAILNWHLIESLLPDSFLHALFVYRGHGHNVALVQELFKSLPNECKVGLFFDYDPKGLQMAYEYSKYTKCRCELIIPSEITDTVSKLSKKDEYIKQSDVAFSVLKNVTNENFLKEIKNLKKHEYAITQECMIAHKIKLMTINIK